jgi:hypothetical protein
MKTCFLTVLPDYIMVVDISSAGAAQFYTSHQLKTWKEAEKCFRGLGAEQDLVNTIADASTKTEWQN